MSHQWVAGIETGGTKLLARICDRSSGETIAEDRWPTTTADAAFHDLAGFLQAAGQGRLAAVGMAAFGPLIIDPNSLDYGLMQATTKPGWAGSNLRSRLAAEFGIPVAIDTDVNAAAVAEQEFGAGMGVPSLAYVTVGTGIGAGLAINGESLKGAMHPEAGHLPIVRRPDDRTSSKCRFHQHCAEGLVSGPAIEARIAEGEQQPDDPALMELVADYLGQLGASLVMAWSPHRMVWGGGAISSRSMVGMIEERLRHALGGYGAGPEVAQPGFCVPAMLKDAGLEGALLMARKLA